MVASFVVSLQYSVDELLKTFILIFEDRWEAKEQDSDQHGQRRHAIAFPIWKFSQVFWGGFICCCEPTLAYMLANRPARFALPCTIRVELSAQKG